MPAAEDREEADGHDGFKQRHDEQIRRQARKRDAVKILGHG